MNVLDTKSGMVLALGVVGIASVFLIKDSVSAAAADAGQAVNPVNDDNIFNQGVSAVGQKISGDPNWSLGGWIYDIVNGSPEEQAKRAEEQTNVDLWTGNPNR